MIDYEQVRHEQLIRRHPDYAYWEHAWSDFRLLYRGGEEFRRAAGQQYARSPLASPGMGTGATGFLEATQAGRRARRFLHQLEGEPDAKYNRRWERAFYIGFLPAIIDYFNQWLFTVPPIVRPTDGGEAPDWWSGFSADVSGGGKSILDFAKDSFLDVLILRRAGWLIGTPDIRSAQMSRAEAEGAHVNHPVLTSYAAEEILDWERDGAGALQWVLLRKQQQVRTFPADRVLVEIYTYLDRDSWGVWQVSQDGPNDADGKPTHVAQLMGAARHDLGEVPFRMLEAPHGLWVANKLASWQVDMFNQANMLSYGLLVSCFLQPYIKSNDFDTTRIFGEGTLLNLRAGTKEIPGEEFGWAAPAVAPLQFSAETLKDKRDEGYRIVHQMALAVDQQAVNVSRSGTSKAEDRRAMEVILVGYGSIVRDAIVGTLNLVSQVLGDSTEWECAGFQDFSVPSLDDVLAAAAQAQALNVPSPTFRKVMLGGVATGALVGHLDEATKQKIRDEIDEGVDEEEERKMAPQFGAPPDPNAPPPPEADGGEPADAADGAAAKDAPPEPAADTIDGTAGASSESKQSKPIPPKRPARAAKESA